MSTRVAVVQAEPGTSREDGLDRTARFVREAAALGAQLVAFPETWIPGYPIWLDVCRDAGLWDHEPVKRVFATYAAESVDVRGADGRALGEIARANGVALALGVSERVSAGHGYGTLYNTFVVYAPNGDCVVHHRKLVPTYTERMIWGNGDGDGLGAAALAVGRVGGLICWEHWMPLARQAMHESGEDIHVAVWPQVHEMLQLASRSYAFEGRCFVLAAGSLLRPSRLPSELAPHPDRVPPGAEWVMRGGSAIIGPDGRYLVEPVFDRETILVADLDLSRLAGERMNLDVAGHYARPDVLSLTVKRAQRSS